MTRIGRRAAAAQADAFAYLLRGGTLEIRSGEAPPAPDEPATGDVLARFQLRMLVAPPSLDGSLALYPPEQIGKSESGRAGWFRARMADGSAVWDGTVGTEESADLMLNTLVLRRGGTVRISAALYVVRAG